MNRRTPQPATRHANLPRHDSADRRTRVERSLAQVDRLELVIRCVELGLAHRDQTDQQLREALARRVCEPLSGPRAVTAPHSLTGA